MTHILVHVLKIFTFVIIFNVIQLRQVSTQVDIHSKKNQLTECPRFHTQNITGGEILANGSYLHVDKVYPPGHFGHFDYYLDGNGTEVNTTGHIRGCTCTHSERKCARVCCFGEEKIPEICPHEFNDTTYHKTIENAISIHKHYQLIYHNIECPLDRNGVPRGLISEPFVFNENGSIWIPADNSFLDYDQHCVAVEGNLLLVLRCPVLQQREKRFRMIGIGMLMSVPFLLVTFVVYAVISELRNIHGLLLMSYVGGLTVAYSFLSIVQLIGTQEKCYTENVECYDPTACTVSGYIIYFSFMLSFFWLNTMCFDIFWTFSKLRGNASGTKNFWFYCTYAWGMASFLTVLALSLDMSGISQKYKPGMFYSNTCFIQPEHIAQFLYFYLILLILLPINIVLFAKTAYRIKKVQSETAAVVEGGQSGRHTKANYDKFRFLLYFRLFIIMGVTWTMELISGISTYGDSPWFYLTDLINCLQGVLIFILFVCNKKVRQLVVKRYQTYKGTPLLSRSIETTETSQIQNQMNGVKLQNIETKLVMREL